MSKKLTLDINFIDTPRDGDKFGYQISNNGVPLSFNGFDGWDKTFKGASDYSIAAGSIMAFEADLTPSVSDNSDIGAGFDSYVNVIKTQSNGKYICVGGFTSYQGTSLSSRRICRLNTDFTLDTTFTPPDFPVYVECMEIDSNDKIYVGSNNVISGKGRLVRLNANGTIDTAYMPGIGFDRPVTAIKLQPDGKLIVAGLFTTFNSTPRKGIVRLTTGGIFDTTFNGVTTGFATVQDYPRSIAVQSTGRIIVGGDFYSYNGTPCRNTIIINANGSAFSGPAFLDNSPSGTYGANVLKVLVDSLDRIYVCGKFTRIANSSTVQRIIRLTSLGIEDTGFNVSASGLTNGTTSLTLGGFDMIINSNDNLVVVGNFTNAAGQPFTNIAVYSDTGAISPDSEFGTGTFTATGAPVIYSLVQVGTKYIVGGTFNSYSTTDVAPVSSQFVIPLEPNLNIDFGDGLDNTPVTMSIRNNKILVAGDFTTYDTINSVGKVVRLESDGTIDSTFDTTGGVQSGPGAVVSSSIDINNKVYLGGDITSYNGTSTSGIVRINDDGTFDTTFNTGSGVNNAIVSFIPDDLTEGVLLLGAFDNYNSTSVGYIVKLTATGSIDSNFNTATGFNNATICGVEDNGSYIIGGVFNQFNGLTSSVGLIKLTATGSKDNTFTSKATSGIYGLAKQSNGKIICMSPDVNNVYNGITITGALFRIDNNGSYDGSFNSSTYIPGLGGVRQNLICIDGQDRIYVFSVGDQKIIRFTKDGTLDTSFNTTELTSASTNYIWSMKVYFNNIIVVGTFEVNGITKNICMLDFNGDVVTTDIDNYQNIINTYDNLTTFNTGYGVIYSLYSDKVRMLYEFDNDEIVLNNVFDTPDYVEITYTNESLTIADLIQEVVVRSPYLIITNSASFSSVNYKIRVYEGSIFTGPSQSVSYDIDKDKLFTGQSNIYININNLVRERLEANISTFNDETFLDSQFLPENMSKWVLVDETIFDGSATQSLNKYYLHALDGYLYNYEEQGSPNIFINGDKRYIHRDQPQRIYFQTNFLLDVTVMDEFGNTYNPNWESFDILGDNKKYIQSFQVDTYFSGYTGARPPYLTTYIDYIFTYKSDNNGDELTGRTYDVTQRFYIYDDCKYDLYTIVYKNKFGVLESIPFSRKTMKSVESKGVDYERSILDYNGNYDITRHTSKEYNVNGYESWTLNTNWLPEYMNDAFEELNLSEEVWIIMGDDSIIPVIKEDKKIDFKTVLNDKLIQYTLKVKMSHQVIKNIL